MKLRNAVASVAVAGALTLGVAGTASAQGNAPTSSVPGSGHLIITCEHAKERLDKIEAHLTKVEERIANAGKAVEKMRSQGRNDAADRLQKRIDAAKERIADVRTRLHNVETRVAERCK